MNVWLAADNAGTVLKKYGKTSFFDSSPEAADDETYEKQKITKKCLKNDAHTDSCPHGDTNS